MAVVVALAGFGSLNLRFCADDANEAVEMMVTHRLGAVSAKSFVWLTFRFLAADMADAAGVLLTLGAWVVYMRSSGRSSSSSDSVRSASMMTHRLRFRSSFGFKSEFGFDFATLEVDAQAATTGRGEAAGDIAPTATRGDADTDALESMTAATLGLA
jgi:hypothetical protein